MNSHQEAPGKGVLYAVQDKKYPKGPDHTGFITLEMDYKAGEKLQISAWSYSTKTGHVLISLKEDNWTKKKSMGAQPHEPREVLQGYQKDVFAKRGKIDDEEIPF